jgi:hypothetical protein
MLAFSSFAIIFELWDQNFQNSKQTKNATEKFKIYIKESEKLQ